MLPDSAVTGSARLDAAYCPGEEEEAGRCATDDSEERRDDDADVCAVEAGAVEAPDDAAVDDVALVAAKEDDDEGPATEDAPSALALLPSSLLPTLSFSEERGRSTAWRAPDGVVAEAVTTEVVSAAVLEGVLLGGERAEMTRVVSTAEVAEEAEGRRAWALGDVGVRGVLACRFGDGARAGGVDVDDAEDAEDADVDGLRAGVDVTEGEAEARRGAADAGDASVEDEDDAREVLLDPEAEGGAPMGMASSSRFGRTFRSAAFLKATFARGTSTP